MNENIYFCYEHHRPDKGICFYVGKGKYPKRAFDMRLRSRWHKAVTSKLTSMGLCVDVRIVASGLSEDDAFRIEKERIAFYGLENLVNMTPGGEGRSGLKASPETRKKLSDAARKRGEDPEYKEQARQKMLARWADDGQRAHMTAQLVIAAEARRGEKRGPHSSETKRKISEANKGKHYDPPSEETRRKISIANKGKVIGIETRQKISASNTGKKRTEEQKAAQREWHALNPFSEDALRRIGDSAKLRKNRLGAVVSDETKALLRENGLKPESMERFAQYAHLGPAASAKRVICIDDGMVFESVSAAARHYDVDSGALSELCNGKRGRKTLGKRRFRFVDEEAA